MVANRLFAIENVMERRAGSAVRMTPLHRLIELLRISEQNHGGRGLTGGGRGVRDRVRGDADGHRHRGRVGHEFAARRF